MIECKNEIWKDIEGYEGIYQVSNYGRIKSLHNKFGKKELIMQTHKKRNGYNQIRLKNKGTVKDCIIHRLVAKAFVPNPNNLPCVNHINEKKQDNRAENLEWCTVAYNNVYGTRIERVKAKTSKPVYQYTIDGKLVKIYKSLAEASKINNCSRGNISQCCLGSYKTSHGFVWRYESEVV